MSQFEAEQKETENLRDEPMKDNSQEDDDKEAPSTMLAADDKTESRGVLRCRPRLMTISSVTWLDGSKPDEANESYLRLEKFVNENHYSIIVDQDDDPF